MAKDKNQITIKNNIFLASLLFLCLISFVSTQDNIEWLDYNYTTRVVETEINNAKNEKTYVLVFDTEKRMDEYIKVTVTPLRNTITPFVCFSPTDANCNENRQAIARVPDGSPAILLLRKDQFYQGEDEIYIFVKCKEETCNYRIKFEGMNHLEIAPNTIYSYLVVRANREMEFDIVGEAEEKDFLTIGIEGSTSAKIEVNNIEKIETSYDFGYGRILSFYPNVNSNSGLLATFSIKSATEGDYITLNTHIVKDNRAPDNLLFPNGNVVMGIIDSSLTNLREECFPISSLALDEYEKSGKFYLTGRIHSKYALFWLADEKNIYMPETEMEISDGQLSYLIKTEGKARSVCFEPSYEDVVNKGKVAYSLSILEPIKLDSLYDYYPPQVNNQFYRRMIPKGKYSVFHGEKLDSTDKKYGFDVYNRKGVVEVYSKECTTFPFCTYTVKNDFIKKDSVKAVNKMSIFEKENNGNKMAALDSKKNVVVLYCKDDDNEDNGFCEVDVSITIPGREMPLIENEKYSKYVLKEDKGSFLIDLKKGMNVKRLTIDIMVYSGDVDFTIRDYEKTGENYNFYKYYLSNKIFYHYDMNMEAINSIYVDYTAEYNSFFTIQYGINATFLIRKDENLTSGESYLVEIDPTSDDKDKTINLYNHRYKKKQPFLANFFALNCDFNVTRDGVEIAFFDGYAQEILLSNSRGYSSEKYEYKIKIERADLANYNHKMCMLYVSGYESKDEEYQTEIVIGQNVNQQIIFNDDFNNIRFLYPQANPEKDLAIYFNVIDQGLYEMNLYANNEQEPFSKYSITRSQILFISKTEITSHCPANTLCNIILDTTLTGMSDFMPKTEPMIEITVREVLNNPSYLQKNIAKRDFTCGDNLYYLYMELGKNEAGDVSVNFLRDWGLVWGRIVRKDSSEIEEEASWRGKYRMPAEDWDDNQSDGYIKKYVFTSEDTKECIEGCYLLLTIRISQYGDYVEDSHFYPFTIITTIHQNTQAYTDIPKIVIQANEYIIGNVDISTNERISQFYEIWLPHDSYYVYFDWQSEVAGLYINVGGTRPTTRNADFKLLPPGRDSVLYLESIDILQKAKQKKISIPNENSLEDINLVIGVWTDKTDSVETEIFSLRVYQPNQEDDLDITEVNTEQKIMCRPNFVMENQYRCLFMVTYDDEDERLEMPLIIHASSVNQSAEVSTYASFIERKYYDKFDKDELKKSTPTYDTAQYNTRSLDSEYIFVKLIPGRTKNYLYVNVVSNKRDDIMLLTSMPMYSFNNTLGMKQYFSNPSTQQLLFVEDKLRLIFFTSSSLIINIVTLGGEAELAWAEVSNTIYNLRGKGDRLTLTSGTTLTELNITRRGVNNKLSADEDPGFVFYVSYYVRDGENNFDEVQFGKSLEIAYRDTNLPVYLYSKLDNYYSDVSISITFKDSFLDNKAEYKTSPLTVRASVEKESVVYRAKQTPDLAPNIRKAIVGSYDPAIKTAQVFLYASNVSAFDIKKEEIPTLYLAIEENERVPSEKYKQFTIEAQFTQVNSDIVPVEKIFNYARYSGYFTNYYKLKIDRAKPYMIVELAFNSKYLNYGLNLGNEYSDQRRNASDLIIDSHEQGGKKVLTLKNPSNKDYIYLHIFKAQTSDIIAPKLYNYVFKYINIEKLEDFVEYKILNDNNLIIVEKNEENENNETVIQCTFNRIDIDPNKANITYFFKVVDNASLIYPESYETIAVMESPYYTVYERNPQYGTDGKITLTAKGDLSNWAYLQVIAQIQQDTILDYVAYKGEKHIREPDDNGGNGGGKKKEEEEDSGVNTTVLAIIIAILICLVVGLFVVAAIIQKKNKSLVDQVKHISFQQNASANASQTGSADPDLLLHKNQ